MYLVIENGVPAYFCNKRMSASDIEVEDWQNNIDCFVSSGDTFVYDTSNHAAKEVRLERDLRLLRCDWTQLTDVPEEVKNAYTDYRQALRDIPQQDGFPQTIEWPIEPN